MRSTLISLALFALTATAHAATDPIYEQTVTCVQLTKAGAPMKRGAEVKLVLSWNGGETEFKLENAKSSVVLKNVWKKGSGYGEKLSNLHLDRAMPQTTTDYTTVFFNDDYNGGDVSYQLQFDIDIAMAKFKNKKADFVVSLDDIFAPNDAQPLGYSLSCSSDPVMAQVSR